LRVQLVSAADKLHNATAIVSDAKFDLAQGQVGAVWRRFNASPNDIIWYYRGVVAALQPQLAGTSLLLRLSEAVEQLELLLP
jgi:hypothetical protein